MRVIGIDPGLNELGYAVLEDEEGVFKVLALGTIKQPKNKASLSSKLASLFTRLQKVLEDYRPELIAVEEVFSQTYPAATTKLAQAQALVFLLAGLHKLRIKSFNPSQVKGFLTGNGRAEKEDLSRVLFLMMENGVLRGISKEELLNSHANDALAIALVCLMQRGE